MTPPRIALAQINTVPGDIPGNASLIRAAWQRADQVGADLVVFPELALVGYSPRDLLFRPRFVDRAMQELRELASSGYRSAALVGTALPRQGVGRPFWNGAALLRDGRIEQTFHKELLPVYDVFDEARYFEPGRGGSFNLRGHRIGVTICEDLWFVGEGRLEIPSYSADPVAQRAAEGAEVIVNLSASPYHWGKATARQRTMVGAARRSGCPVLLCNVWGGNDEILFDGGSCAVAADGSLIVRGRRFANDLLVVDSWVGETEPSIEELDIRELREALVMGLRDYASKCGFREVVLGLSGGIDSALTACLAVEALGNRAVRGLAMPSRFSSRESVEDAMDLAQRLQIRCDLVPIENAYAALTTSLEPALGSVPFGLMHENLQARIRGVLLMGVSNQTGALLVTTGNKSELATGYCTLYGDMCGGLAAISDVYKTEVYALAATYEEAGQLPHRSMTKAPSAELRPNQTDQDSLPPYSELDRMLAWHLEEGWGATEIVEKDPGLSLATVQRVLALVARSEYKRKQAAPGLRVSRKAFGYGRRVPLVASRLDFLDPGTSRVGSAH